MDLRIITGGNSGVKPLRQICAESVRRYKQRLGAAGHGRRMKFYEERIPDEYEREPSWAKIGLIRQHLPQCDFVLWLDCDALVIGDIDLRSIIGNATLNIATDHNGINCGVMAWKNCPESFYALDRIESNYRKHQWFEQAALMEFVHDLHVCRQNKTVWNAYRDDRTEDTLILHFPGMSNDERLPLMQAELEKLQPTTDEIITDHPSIHSRPEHSAHHQQLLDVLRRRCGDLQRTV